MSEEKRKRTEFLIFDKYKLAAYEVQFPYCLMTGRNSEAKDSLVRIYQNFYGMNKKNSEEFATLTWPGSQISQKDYFGFIKKNSLLNFNVNEAVEISNRVNQSNYLTRRYKPMAELFLHLFSIPTSEHIVRGVEDAMKQRIQAGLSLEAQLHATSDTEFNQINLPDHEKEFAKIYEILNAINLPWRPR